MWPDDTWPDDTRPRRLPILSGGLEIKLKLKFQAPAKLADKMKVFIRNAYDYNFDEVNADDDDADEENEDYDFWYVIYWSSIIYL